MYRNDSKKVYKHIAKGIHRSVHFAIPDDGVVFDDNLRGLIGQDLRLPYPEITIECAITYNTDTEIVGKDLIIGLPCSKSLIYAREFTGSILHKFRSDILNNEILKQWVDVHMGKWFYDAECVIEMVPFAGSKGLPWMVNPVQIVFNSKWTSDSELELIYLPTNMTMIDDAIKDGVADQVFDTAYASAFTLLEFLEALTCKNVKQSIHQEARKNNDKWVRLGKLPMYETKVLTIDTTEKEYIGSSGGSGRSHASPRQHLRRGHIRKLESGNIWVNSCVVGSAENGRLDKSYKVK